jgi:NAD(P)-dependent dehydrogenase (short-subunit alcohol dehydrogenase family)
VNVTSGSHRRTNIVFDNPNLEGIYTPPLGYAQSKTANILMANEIERLYGGDSSINSSNSGLGTIHGLSVHPGCIITNLQQHQLRTPEEREAFLQSNPVLQKVLKSTAQGAATQVWAAVAKVWEGKGAVYLEDCRLGVEVEEPDMVTGGYKDYVFDIEGQKKLWDLSCSMVGIDT